MEESDKLLVTSLRDFIEVPNEIQTLRDIRTEQIFVLACNLFENLGVDYSELKSMNSKTQRFRSMTRLTQTLNRQLDTSFELNDIMSPTVTFMRKLILVMISKIGSSQLADQSKGKRIEKNNEKKQKKYQKQAMMNWFNKQWILPELDEPVTRKYEPYRLKITLKKDTFKRNMVNELINVSGNAHAIIQSSLTEQTIQRRKKEADEGITRKQQEQLGRTVYQIVKNNQNDWNQAEKKKKKLKKNLIEEQQAQQKNKDNISIFQQQVQQIAVQKKKNVVERKISETNESTSVEIQEESINPLQRIKKQCENKKIQLERRLQQIINILNNKKTQIENMEVLKQKLEEQVGLYEDRVQAERDERPMLKKQAQKMKLLLESVQGGESLTAKQVKQLEQQVNYLDKQANKQIKQLEQQILTTKTEGANKIQILRDLKVKLSKIQIDYHNVLEEIQQKNEIKSKAKIHKSGISRTYYNKKISEMEVRWRQTRKEANKIKTEVEKIREQSFRYLSLAQRSETQLENIISSSKFKGQTDNNNFKDVVVKCKKTFSQTIGALQKINTTKQQINEYEAMVHSLSGKDYSENIKRIKVALQQLNKQINQIQKNTK